MISEDDVRELLRLKGGRLHHREGQELEFKEQFNLAALADYFRDFAAFANNRGGYLIFAGNMGSRLEREHGVEGNMGSRLAFCLWLNSKISF